MTTRVKWPEACYSRVKQDVDDFNPCVLTVSMSIPQQKPAKSIPGLAPLSIARVLWKWKVVIVLIWALITVVTGIVVSRIPSIYRAEALILVDTQKIPDKYVSSTVVNDAQDRLASISQQILSASRLEKIMDDLHLYREERATHFKEDVLAMMRADIQTTPEKTWNGRTAAFRVSYQGRDPNVVTQVANKIANLYVEENLRVRETQARGTSEFIETQLKEAQRTLDQLEAAVSQYKLRHNGELPQQEGSLNGILSRLGVRLEANRDAINRAQQEGAMLQDSMSIAQDSEANQVRQLEAAAATAARPQPATTGIGGAVAKPPKRSEEIGKLLADARLKYSDSHPEIRRLRAQLEQARDQESKAPPEAPPKPKPPASASDTSVQKPKRLPDTRELAQTRERIASLRAQLDLAKQEIDNRKAEQQQILGDISLYQGRLSSLPIREQEMAALTRDYEISKANYRSLLDKKISAEMSTDMERREKSERFTIVDPARVPARPFKPNRRLLMLAGSLAGLAVGAALLLARELYAARLLGEWELPAGTPILGRLPFIEVAGVIDGKSSPDAGSDRKLRRMFSSAAT